MARRIRLDAARVAHHVMLRGLDGARLFLDADDHQDFVDRLSRLLPECDARCFAWAILPNHVHLAIQTENGELSRVMRRLNTGYAMRFNRAYERKGYVFQDRFCSRIVTGDADLMGLIRYVHRNPLEAGLVHSLDALARFPWSGHAALVGVRPPLPFEAASETLALFGSHPARARAALRAWMARTELRQGEIADAPAPRGGERSSPPSSPRPSPFEPRGQVGLEALLEAACERYGLTPEELASGSKQPHIAHARAVVAWVAAVELRLARRPIAGALGVTPATVSAALARGRRGASGDAFSAVAVLQRRRIQESRPSKHRPRSVPAREFPVR
jgi:REP element-mobilizing transposase RayT